jgi:lysozyme family protein
MDDFDKAIIFVLQWETAGGTKIRHRGAGEDFETMYGFSQQAHPEINFDTFTKDQARAKYLNDYWERYGCDEMRWPFNFVHMDCCVNVGNETAGKWHGRANMILQRALGIKPDGDIGPITRGRMREAVALPLAARMIVQRQKYYRTLAKKWQDTNLNGVLNRAEALLLEIML